MNNNHLTVPILCAFFAFFSVPSLFAEGPPQSPSAAEAEVNCPIVWGPNTRSISVFVWETPAKVTRYGVLQGPHHPIPSIAILEEKGHCFDTVDELISALPKGRLIMMSVVRNTKTPFVARTKLLKAASDAGLLIMGGC